MFRLACSFVRSSPRFSRSSIFSSQTQSRTKNHGGSFRLEYVGGTAVGLGVAFVCVPTSNAETNSSSTANSFPEELTNFSGTHQCHPRKILYPESFQELEAILRDAHTHESKLRVVGSGLSPNGIGFSDDTVVSLGLLDKVVGIDVAQQRITVQAGATVTKVLESLRPHGLTLQNLASINEQQLGGFIQVSAHGTGSTIGPVDEQVVSMKLLSPALGLLTLSHDTNPELFHFAKVGLGCLGVVTEVTLQCVPAHKLLETTFVQSTAETRARHQELLSSYRHLRYMWIPYTDSVVVVGSNPITESVTPIPTSSIPPPSHVLEPLHDVYRAWHNKLTGEFGRDSEARTVAALRDHVLSVAPVNVELVKALNNAEAEAWRRLQGQRVADSDKVLAFECGGQQWVWEACFPATQYPNADIDFVIDTLKLIEQHNLPAPAPIEQRWTSASRSPMSPAYAPDPKTVFSWVGIIMYIPTQDKHKRDAIAHQFSEYQQHVSQLLEAANGSVHWAKIEPPHDPESLSRMRSLLHKRFDVSRFNHFRQLLDPRNILANSVIDELLPRDDL